MVTKSGLFLATIYNQSQLAERKHVARYWLTNVATAVPLSAHPSPLVITTKLAAAILGVPLFGGGDLPAQYYRCETNIIAQTLSIGGEGDTENGTGQAVSRRHCSSHSSVA